MRDIEDVLGVAVAGGTAAPSPLFADVLPDFEYLPVLPPLPVAGAGEA